MPSRCLRLFWCACAGLTAAGPSACLGISQTIWISDSNGVLGTVDSMTGTPTMIGPTGTYLTDIAFDSMGNLWGVGGPDFQWLYSVNQTTGFATPIGDMGAPINSLACGPDGTMYGAYAALVTIDLTSAALTLVGPTGFQASGDIAFHGGTLYMSAVHPSGSGSDVLVSLNPLSGAGTLIGPFGPNGVWGLGSGTDGVLYGGVGNNIISIDTLTGAASLVSSWPIFNGSFGGVAGMDIPVPGPSGACALLLAACGYGSGRRRRAIW